MRAVNEVCAGMEMISVERPVLMADLRPRVGVENRLPEFIEEAIQMEPVPPECCRCCGGPASRERNIWPTDSSVVCGATNATG